MTSSTQTLTADQVQQVVRKLLESYFDTKNEIAAFFGVGARHLRDYEKRGLPDKMNGIVKRAWLRAAAETGVTETDESIAGVFL